MSSTSAPLEPLVSAASEAEAAVVVDFLADRGIQAVVVGAFTAQFKAEAPGEVRVLVHRDDLEAARSALAEIQPQLPLEQTTAADLIPPEEDGVYGSRLATFGRVAAVVLLLATAIGDLVCLAIALRSGDFDFFLGSAMTAVMLVGILLLWRFGPRPAR